MSFRFLLSRVALAFWEEGLEECDCACGGATVDFEAALGGAGGFLTALGAAEEFVDGVLEFSSVGDLDRAAGAEEGFG